MTKHEMEAVKESIFEALEYYRRQGSSEPFGIYMNQATFNMIVFSWGSTQEREHGCLIIRGKAIPVVIDNSISRIMQESAGAKVYSSDIEIRPLPTFGRVPK